MADRGLDKVFLWSGGTCFDVWWVMHLFTTITDHFRLGSDSDGLNFDMGRL